LVVVFFVFSRHLGFADAVYVKHASFPLSKTTGLYITTTVVWMSGQRIGDYNLEPDSRNAQFVHSVILSGVNGVRRGHETKAPVQSSVVALTCSVNSGVPITSEASGRAFPEHDVVCGFRVFVS
jgi:hypothetical protein